MVYLRYLCFAFATLPIPEVHALHHNFTGGDNRHRLGGPLPDQARRVWPRHPPHQATKRAAHLSEVVAPDHPAGVIMYPGRELAGGPNTKYPMAANEPPSGDAEVWVLSWRPQRQWVSSTKVDQASHRWISRVRHWHPYLPGRSNKETAGIRDFFHSAVIFEWIWFFLALVCFVMLHLCLFDWPSSRWYHSVALLIWIGAASLYDLVVWERLGPEAGLTWLSGYFLEFVFSIENVFIYHIVVEAFEIPRKHAQKALFIVVCCQVAFQMIFFMGLASFLRALWVLPYLLGIWLLYVGITAAREGEHAKVQLGESIMFRIFCRLLSGRFLAQYRNDCSVTYTENGRTKVSMLFPATACLLLVDFIMEIDVTLAKIENIDNHYVGFTSSVAAAFAVPELFFVARDMFKQFYLLKYGVSFVLIFFGSELLLNQFVHIPDMVGIAIITVVLVLCIALSKVLGYTSRQDEEGDSEPEPQESAGPKPSRLEG